MKLGLGINEPTEERLRYVKQLGGDGVTCFAHAMPGYAERGFATVDDMAGLKRTVDSYDLELLVIRGLPGYFRGSARQARTRPGD